MGHERGLQKGEKDSQGRGLRHDTLYAPGFFFLQFIFLKNAYLQVN